MSENCCELAGLEGHKCRTDQPMVDIHEFQELGESWRQNLGIDGTAGDAQDVDHPFIPANPGGPCVACGLAASYRRHQGGAP